MCWLPAQDDNGAASRSRLSLIASPGAGRAGAAWRNVGGAGAASRFSDDRRPVAVALRGSHSPESLWNFHHRGGKMIGDVLARRFVALQLDKDAHHGQAAKKAGRNPD